MLQFDPSVDATKCGEHRVSDLSGSRLLRHAHNEVKHQVIQTKVDKTEDNVVQVLRNRGIYRAYLGSLCLGNDSDEAEAGDHFAPKPLLLFLASLVARLLLPSSIRRLREKEVSTIELNTGLSIDHPFLIEDLNRAETLNR